MYTIIGFQKVNPHDGGDPWITIYLGTPLTAEDDGEGFKPFRKVYQKPEDFKGSSLKVGTSVELMLECDKEGHIFIKGIKPRKE